jgi:hypothetical protein
MFPGLGHADKLGPTAKGIHQGMHFNPPFFEGSIQAAATHTAQ